VKEPAKGPIGRATAVAEGVAAGVRRRQREREPRVVLYARPGEPRMLAPGAKGQDLILALAEKMVAVVDEAEGPTRRDRARARRAAQSEERASRRAARAEDRARRSVGGEGSEES
jgi:hypothetical protein